MVECPEFSVRISSPATLIPWRIHTTTSPDIPFILEFCRKIETVGDGQPHWLMELGRPQSSQKAGNQES